MRIEIALRNEKSLFCSGKILSEHRIPVLKKESYKVKNYELDGDAPKQFIKAKRYGHSFAYAFLV